MSEMTKTICKDKNCRLQLINISECSLSYYALQGHQRIAQGNALGINVKAIYALKGQKRHSICQMNQKKEKKLLYKTILLLVREESKNTIS